MVHLLGYSQKHTQNKMEKQNCSLLLKSQICYKNAVRDVASDKIGHCWWNYCKYWNHSKLTFIGSLSLMFSKRTLTILSNRIIPEINPCYYARIHMTNTKKVRVVYWNAFWENTKINFFFLSVSFKYLD